MSIEVEAVITAVFGERVEIGLTDARSAIAFRARRAGEVVVGDRVVAERVGGDGEADSEVGWRVTGVRERQRCLWRSSRRHASQLVVANVDRLVVVTAIDLALRRGLIDRYLVAAAFQNIPAAIVLNKIDLPESSSAGDSLGVYLNLEYDVFRVSGLTGEGIDTLGAALSSGLSVLVGHSGVGKSTLLNRLVPEAELRTRELSLATGKGRHTTSVVTAHRYRDGIVVDTPGVREFGLVGVEPETVINGFREFAELGRECRFSDCAHRSEPGCAIRRAVEEGRADPERYASYLSLRASLEAGER